MTTEYVGSRKVLSSRYIEDTAGSRYADFIVCSTSMSCSMVELLICLIHYWLRMNYTNGFDSMNADKSVTSTECV